MLLFQWLMSSTWARAAGGFTRGLAPALWARPSPRVGSCLAAMHDMPREYVDNEGHTGGALLGQGVYEVA